MAKHFTLEGHRIDHLKILGLEQVWKDDVFYRRQRETMRIKLMEQTGRMDSKYVERNSRFKGIIRLFELIEINLFYYLVDEEEFFHPNDMHLTTISGLS